MPAKPPFPWRGWLAAFAVAAILAWSWRGTGFSLAVLAQGLPEMGEYLARLTPSAERPWHARYLPEIQARLLETVRIAFAASVIGSALSLPFVLVGTRTLAPARWAYNLGRGFLNLLRTIPDLVLATVLVAALGLGPLPGLVALVFFTFGIVAKLLSDTIETVDPGPMEAIAAAGGTRLQRALFAVFPQVAPDYAAYTLYAFEINVRVAAVLGLVGAGGIGQTLMTDIQLFRYGRIGLVVFSIFVVVLVIDAFSTWLRSRLV
uniref:Phosphonate ABC transporter permease protein phnE n=1 Tax=uncultured Armatimonadetes bacterium TaxID=157466 RepID=A0A6J4HFW4_9BACT|nr:Phosphonate ABC transporter permease protein phnE [uncultured Armatimonadetes bacterium]